MRETVGWIVNKALEFGSQKMDSPKINSQKIDSQIGSQIASQIAS